MTPDAGQEYCYEHDLSQAYNNSTLGRYQLERGRTVVRRKRRGLGRWRDASVVLRKLEIEKSLGEWIKWINERWQDGATLDNIKLVAALEVDVAAVAAVDQTGILGRGKGDGGAGGQFYGGSHATSGDGARGVRGYGGAAITSGDGGIGASGLGGNGAGGGIGGIGVTGVGGSPDGVGVKGEGIGTSPGVWGEGSGIIGSAPTNGAGVHGHGFSSGGPGVSGKGGGTTGEGGNFQGAPGTARGAFFLGGAPTVPGDGGVGYYAVGGAGNGASSEGGFGGHGKGGAGGASGAGGHGLVGEAGSPANAGGKAAEYLVWASPQLRRPASVPSRLRRGSWAWPEIIQIPIKVLAFTARG